MRRRVLHARRQLRERERIAAEQRQVGDLLAVDDLAAVGRAGFEQRRPGATVTSSVSGADLHGQVEAQAIADADLDVFPLGGREPGQRGGQRVAADRHERQHVGALVVRHRVQLGVGALVAQRHADAGQRRLLRVGDRAGDAAAGFLRRARRGVDSRSRERSTLRASAARLDARPWTDARRQTTIKERIRPSTLARQALDPRDGSWHAQACARPDGLRLRATDARIRRAPPTAAPNGVQWAESRTRPPSGRHCFVPSGTGSALSRS